MGLEAELECREVRKPAEIDPVASKRLARRKGSFRRLVPNLPAQAPCAYGKPHAAEDHRAGRGATSDERIGEGAEVGGIDELAAFIVSPPEDTDAGANIRFDGGVSAQGQEPKRSRERHDPEMELLFNLRVVLVDEARVHGRNAAAVETDAEAGIRKLAEAHEPFAVQRGLLEIPNPERQEIQIVHEHVVARS